MHNIVHLKNVTFHGFFFFILMSFTIGVILFSEPKTTGFVIKEPENDIARLNYQTEEYGLLCVGNIPHGECSNTKPLYCDSGQLRYNCYECGCDEGQSCGDFGVCETLEKCADGSFYGECSTGLKGSFCDEGSLIPNCNLCGCEESEICSNNRCVKQQN